MCTLQRSISLFSFWGLTVVSTESPFLQRTKKAARYKVILMLSWWALVRNFLTELTLLEQNTVGILEVHEIRLTTWKYACAYICRSSLLIGFFSNIWSSWSLQLTKHLITRHLSSNCQFCQYVSPFISATMSFRWIRRCVISFPWRFLRWYLYCLLTVHLDKVYSSLLENGKMYLTQFNVFI